jgi:metallo-beta-lactamase class B
MAALCKSLYIPGNIGFKPGRTQALSKRCAGIHTGGVTRYYSKGKIMNMKMLTARLMFYLATVLAQVSLAQDAKTDVLVLVERARSAAGSEHVFLFRQLCASPIDYAEAAPAVGEVTGSLPTNDPDREWYTEPVQVFDDLFYLGQSTFSSWGLRTSEGIILVDAIFENTVEAEVVDGLRKLGIDPAEIRYVIISHAHGDHSGGAGILQQLGARIIMSAADWDLYEATARETVKATRDIIATDGMALTLGEHTVRTFFTPGHTHGTLSTLLPVHDNGTPHLAAVWGGTAFNFRDSPDDPRDLRLGDYARSAVYFQGIARGAGADIILSNHPTYDSSTDKIPRLRERQRTMSHPFVIGNASVLRFLEVAEDCALATRITEQQ